MKIALILIFCPLLCTFAVITPATFDLAAIRDASTLEAKVIQDWKPAAKAPGVRQKLIEITVCEWWPGQKVRLPVTLCAPADELPCGNLIVGNMGLALKPALPSGAMLKLLVEHRVGIVLVGMGTIDAMEPKGMLHLGMKQQLLKTKDARFTPSWIWGMSDMRALTAAVAESGVFAPKKVLATGGSKRGVGAAICGIHDDRFTAIMPVVAPILGNPGGAYVRGSALQAEMAQNAAFLEKQTPTVRQALLNREDNRIHQSISRDEALAAGWSAAEMLRMNDEAWNVCRIAAHRDAVKQRGLVFFYHVGTNDNVCPALLRLGQQQPDFPIYILPGGQHGGPKDSGFTLQTPSQPEADENLLALARAHFFDHRSLPTAPKLTISKNGEKLQITVTTFTTAPPAQNTLSWCQNRHAPYTFEAEYDRWESIPLVSDKAGHFTAEITLPAGAKSLDFISTHTHTENGVPLHFSSPYQRWEPVATRILYTGHSFAGAAPAWLGVLAQQAGIEGYENLGRQALGGSRVIDHWKLVDERNLAKSTLAKSGVDVLTLSPNMQMPDEGIDRFVEMALKHNPDIRVLVQGSWMTWDGLGKGGITNAQRDTRPVSEIRERTMKHMSEISNQLTAINERAGREVCTLIPVGMGVVRLRELLAEGGLPGFTRPSQLFSDNIGHAHPAVLHLCCYMYYAAVFQRDPRGLRGLGNNGWTKQYGTPPPELTAILRSVAWETMQASK